MTLRAGKAVLDINPLKPCQLFGYPHVKRISTGIHDPLLASALCLDNAGARILMIALDILFLDPPTARTIRRQVAAALKIPESSIFISCTHTHSGPVTTRPLSWRNDTTAPLPDPEYLKWVGDRVTQAARTAVTSTVPAELAWTSADATGVGGNRLAANGLTDPDCGILAVRDAKTKVLLSVSLIYGMHPTVMHEDSTLISSDFPHYTRQHLKEQFGDDMAVLYHTAPCGNQSPRYFVKGQTFAEAERLGRKLGSAAATSLKAIPEAAWEPSPSLGGLLKPVELPRWKLMPLDAARARLNDYVSTYKRLKAEGAPHPQVRTAECAIFGAEGGVALAEAEAAGDIDRVLAAYAPLEVQGLRIGDVSVVGMPGECFTDYALEIKRGAKRRTYVISMVNGELQGYIVTPETAAAGGYEASGAVFAPESGAVLVRAILSLVNQAP